MKRLLLPLTLLLLLLTACQREEPLPEATTAAKAIYLKYADRTDLTVALVGGYRGFNAVMFEAPDHEAWLQLCDDFGVHHREDAGALDSVSVSSLKTTITRSYTLDSVPSMGEAFTQVLQELMAQKLDGRPIDTMLCVDTVIRLDTLVAGSVHYDHGVLVDSIIDTTLRSYGVRPPTTDPLMQTALQHGDSGYLVASDSRRLTLCLFFYSTMEEMTQIINHVTNIHTHQ